MNQLWKQMSRAQGLVIRWAAGVQSRETLRGHLVDRWGMTGRERCYTQKRGGNDSKVLWEDTDKWRWRCHCSDTQCSAGNWSQWARNWEIIAQFSGADNTLSICEPIWISYWVHALGKVNIISNMSKKKRNWHVSRRHIPRVNRAVFFFLYDS